MLRGTQVNTDINVTYNDILLGTVGSLPSSPDRTVFATLFGITFSSRPLQMTFEGGNQTGVVHLMEGVAIQITNRITAKKINVDLNRLSHQPFLGKGFQITRDPTGVIVTVNDFSVTVDNDNLRYVHQGIEHHWTNRGLELSLANLPQKTVYNGVMISHDLDHPFVHRLWSADNLGEKYAIVNNHPEGIVIHEEITREGCPHHHDETELSKLTLPLPKVYSMLERLSSDNI